VGSNGWTPQELVFRTGPETTVLTVLVRRLPDPGVLQIPLKGTAWIDNLSLTKIETGVRAGSVH
jgi:hypothetical protein